MDTIGYKIYKLRNDNHLSQEEFSNLIGVSRQTVYQWENDLQIPKTNKLLKICEVFSVDIDYFYPNSTKANTYKDEISSDELDTTNKETSLSENKKKKLTRKQLGIIISLSIILLIVLVVSVLIICLYTYEEEGFETVHVVEYGITQTGILIIISIVVFVTLFIYIFAFVKIFARQKKKQE